MAKDKEDKNSKDDSNKHSVEDDKKTSKDAQNFDPRKYENPYDS
jgi:hypothetical protein